MKVKLLFFTYLLVGLGWLLIWYLDSQTPAAEAMPDPPKIQRPISLVTHEKFGDEWVEQYNVGLDYDNGTIFEWHCPDKNYKFILTRRAEHGNKMEMSQM